jgi:hypothetical protein
MIEGIEGIERIFAAQLYRYIPKRLRAVPAIMA